MNRQTTKERGYGATHERLQGRVPREPDAVDRLAQRRATRRPIAAATGKRAS